MARAKPARRSGVDRNIACDPLERRQLLTAELVGPLNVSVDFAASTSRTYYVAPAGANANPGTATSPFATLEYAVEQKAKADLNAGRPVKILVKPGTYYTNNINLTGLTATGTATPLVIEGEGPVGAVVFKGSRTSAPSGWTLVDAARKIYKRDLAWTNNWGFRSDGSYRQDIPAGTYRAIIQRRELLAVNDTLFSPVLLEDHSYTAATNTWTFQSTRTPASALVPGSFGVYESDTGTYANSLYLRLPDAMPTSSFASAKIEIGELDDELLEIEFKDNLELRNLSFQHATQTHGRDYAGRAVEINRYALTNSTGASRNIRIRDCDFSNNGSTGLDLMWMRDYEVLNVTANNNGHSGVQHFFGQRGTFDTVTANGNNWRGRLIERADLGLGFHYWGSQYGTFRRITVSDNYAEGFRQDIDGAHSTWDDCRFNNNAILGMRIEAAFGDMTVRNTQAIGNGRAGIFLMANEGVTLDGVILRDNGTAQLQIYPQNRSLPEPQYDPAHDYWIDPSGATQFHPVPYVTKTVLKNSTLATSGSTSYLIHRWAEGSYPDYIKWYQQELTASNNRYWNPNNAQMFEVFGNQGYYEHRFTTFHNPVTYFGTTYPAWKNISSVRGFEAGSTWGAVGAPTATAKAFVFETSPCRIAMTFDQPLDFATLQAADLQVVRLGVTSPAPQAATVSYDPATRTAVWSFAGTLADGNYRATLAAGGVAGSMGVASTASQVVDFYVLAGDFNRDRVADFADLGILLNNYNTVGKTFGQGDANYDGSVDFADLGILLNNYNSALAAPAAEPSVAALGEMTVVKSKRPTHPRPSR